jgi:hypothetical protein
MNFGVPKDLLEDETTVLYELTKKLSPNEKRLIYETAKANPTGFKLEKKPLKTYENLTTMLPSSGGYVNMAADLEDEYENVDSVRF